MTATIAAVLIWAVLIWAFGSPLYRYLLRRGLPRPAAVVVAVLLWLVPFIGFIMTMVAWPEKDDPVPGKGVS